MATDNHTSITGGLSKDQPQEHPSRQLIEGIYSFLYDELLQIFSEMLNNSERSLTEQEKSVELSVAADSSYLVDEKQDLEIKALKLLHDERASIHTNFFTAINEQIL